MMALDPIGAGFELAGTIVNKIWPDKTEKEKSELAAALSMIQGQMDINKAEATNNSVFVAGWRPFIGWTCGLSFFAKYVGGPAAFVLAQYLDHPFELPKIETAELFPILLGMLGLGALRTVEKVKGVN
jgi:hypothetical protein